jgi:hypothetical protein
LEGGGLTLLSFHVIAGSSKQTIDTKRRQAGALQITSPDHVRPHKMVGIEASAKSPFRFRAQRRIVRLLRAHIQNKSEQSGKTAATRARLLLCKTSKAKSK